jgi:hypothetical protein
MNERLKELAEQAGLDPCVFYDNLLRISDFAELVRQDEREAITKMFEAKIWAYEKREIVAAIRARGKK